MAHLSLKGMSGLLLAGIMTIGLVAAAEAQQAPPRIRGEITKVAGDDVTIKSPDGKSYDVVLAKDVRVQAVVPMKIEDIKPGQFLSITAEPVGGDTHHLKGIGISIFPPGNKPGPGQRPWDKTPTSLMTNADVTASVMKAGAGEITVAANGETYKLDMPPGTPVVTSKPGTKDLVKPGAKVFINGPTMADGKIMAPTINVGTEGAVPPQ
jgi:hypothetical protein